MKPVIGITTFMMTLPRKTYAAVSSNYICSIRKTGGTPLLLPMVEDIEVLGGYLNVIDGLLLTGGDEGINPQLYGENPVKELEYICPERDDCEAYLFEAALKKGLPVLGVCRGMQLMNVVAGGSLYQDIFSQLVDSLGHLPKQMPVDALYHKITFTEGSILEKVFSAQELMVNSFHHQAVKRVADSFVATAISQDNIIEGIEHREHPFAVGVQWHPEDLTSRYSHFLKLFKAFVDAAYR
jgi:putative glutamine amidotransferase